jgi:molybdopterin-guanine dinucleotide biosynthesis protein A
MADGEIPGVKVTSIVLCGGKERRFGSNKALAIVAGKTAIERVVERLEPVSDSVLFVTSPEKANLPVSGHIRTLVDKFPGKGPLGGIYTGLIEAHSSKAIVVGCDMPFLNTRLLKKMIMMADGFDAVIPRLEGGMIEPLHAVYATTCAAEMKVHLDNDRLSITELIRELKVRYMERDEYLPLDPGMLSFFNLNYPEDLERANALANGGASVPGKTNGSGPPEQGP